MTNGPGKVYWSSLANRFYQEGRRGAVSRENAVPTLRFNRETRIWHDQRDGAVPNKALGLPDRLVRRFLAHDKQGRPFVSTEFVDKITTRPSVEGTQQPGNQMVVIRTVVRTPDGKAHVSYTSSKLGARINMNNLEKLANKRAAGQLRGKGYDIATNEIENKTITREYITRTVKVRSPSI